MSYPVVCPHCQGDDGAWLDDEAPCSWSVDGEISDGGVFSWLVSWGDYEGRPRTPRLSEGMWVNCSHCDKSSPLSEWERATRASVEATNPGELPPEPLEGQLGLEIECPTPSTIDFSA